MAQGRGSSRRSGGRLRRAHGRRPGELRAWRRAGVEPAAQRPRLTGRAAVLVLVLAALMMSYGSSLRAYLDQRHHIASLRASIAESEQAIAELEREKQRWRDPAYVVAQARARFAFGFPGEIGYRVLDEQGRPLDQEGTLSEPPTPDDGPEWWETTLDSIAVAGDPPRDAGPAARITAPSPPERDR